MEVMGKLAGCLSLALCVYGLKAEFIGHAPLQIPEFVNTPCVFPFMYHEVVHYSCTTMHTDFAWCSLDEKFQGRWRYCTGQDPPKCTFPFTYRGKQYNSCTNKHYVFNRSWCSLTKDYDRDRKWKQCSPYSL